MAHTPCAGDEQGMGLRVQFGHGRHDDAGKEWSDRLGRLNSKPGSALL